MTRADQFIQKTMENRFQIKTIEECGPFDLHSELLRVDNEIIRHSVAATASNTRRRDRIKRERAKLIVALTASKKSKSIFPTAKIAIGDSKFSVFVKTEVAEQIVDLVKYLNHARSKSYQQETEDVVTLAAEREAKQWMELNEEDDSRFEQNLKFNLRENRLRYIRENRRAWEIPGSGGTWLHDNKLIKNGPSPWEWLAPAILDSQKYIGICRLDICQQVFYKARINKQTCSNRCRSTLAQRVVRDKDKEEGTSCAKAK